MQVHNVIMYVQGVLSKNSTESEAPKKDLWTQFWDAPALTPRTPRAVWIIFDDQRN